MSRTLQEATVAVRVLDRYAEHKAGPTFPHRSLQRLKEYINEEEAHQKEDDREKIDRATFKREAMKRWETSSQGPGSRSDCAESLINWMANNCHRLPSKKSPETILLEKFEQLNRENDDLYCLTHWLCGDERNFALATYTNDDGLTHVASLDIPTIVKIIDDLLNPSDLFDEAYKTMCNSNTTAMDFEQEQTLIDYFAQEKERRDAEDSKGEKS